MDHYRCFKCYIPKVGSERILETVQFFPQKVKMPSISSQDAAINAINDLTYAIKNPTHATHTLILGNEKTNALRNLAEIFNSAINQIKKLQPPNNVRPEPRMDYKKEITIPAEPRVIIKLEMSIKIKENPQHLLILLR